MNETPRYLNFSDCFSGTPSIWNQIISAWKQTLMMVEIFTTLVDTVLLTAYQIVQPFLDFVLTS